MELYDLVPELAVQVPHVPAPLAVAELRRASRQFCQDSHIWQRPFDIYTVNRLGTYDISLPEAGSKVAVEWLALDGKRLDGRSTQVSIDDARNGKPDSYYELPGLALGFAPVPDKQYHLKGVISLQPVRNTNDLPDWLADEWGDAIVALATTWLAAIPAKDWTNPEAVAANQARYQMQLGRAVKQARGESQPAVRTVAYGGL